MYVPREYREDAKETLHGLIAAHSFGILITTSDDGPLVSHLPFLLESADGERGTLLGHVARANPHARVLDASLESRRALVVFRGPHAYVSPNDYASAPAVPTWNYVAVHARGTLRRLDAAALGRLLDALTDRHEASLAPPWSTRALPREYRAKLENAIVGFDLVIEHLEGKLKLGQNRSLEDRAKAASALRARGEVEVARAMEATLQVAAPAPGSTLPR